MLLDSGLHERFWSEAVAWATYLQNRLPSRSVEKTPFELFLGQRPDVGHIRVFGSRVFTYVPKEKRKKFGDRAKEGVMIGYSDTIKGYRILDPNTDRIWHSCSVKVVETDKIVSQHVGTTNQQPEGDLQKWIPISLSRDEEQTLLNPEMPNSSIQEEEMVVDNEEAVTCDEVQPLQLSPPASPLQELTKPKVTLRRSQRINKGQPPERLSLKAETVSSKEPSTWEEVMKLQDREKGKWIVAAKEEMGSLLKHDVWELADLPAGKRAISCKWVFKEKLDAKGHVHTYKARLVARGFSQKYGSDYDETFAPVVKHETVRILLAVAAAKGLNVRQLDVRSAYLNGELEEELYMEQPPGFIKQGQEDKVLRLKKSLYGLKQSARAWNKRVTDVLFEMNFQQSKADPCLFTRKERDGSISYILVYVDDLLVAGSSVKVTKEISEKLNSYFEIKDLGDVAYYLGIKIDRDDEGSFLLSQELKISQMLEEYGLSQFKPVKTPMETGFLAADPDKSPKLENNHQYRQAIGSLMYLATVTRPDIAVAVNILARRVEQPTQSDWNSIKRIIRFLGSTINQKLKLSSTGDEMLRCFVDADWAGDRQDRKSTTGYVFQLGESTVAWCSQKQTTVAMSSTEAEYVAASHTAKELLWIRQLLRDMEIFIQGTTEVFEDNQGCIKLIESDRSGARTKHIDVCHHQLRGLKEDGIIKMIYCPTQDMVADIMTKPLPQVLFNKFSAGLGLKG